MKKIIVLFVILISLTKLQAQTGFESTAKDTGVTNESKEKEKIIKQPTIFDYKVTDINGEIFSFLRYKGSKIMIVNTASKCGYTAQYAELQELYDTYKNKNFIIIAFPSNDFGNQEPGDNAAILKFCSSKYNVSFPIMSKVTVKGGEKCPVYKYLTDKKMNGFNDDEVEWNFQKFLINENGVLEKVIPSKVSPLDEEIVSWVKG